MFNEVSSYLKYAWYLWLCSPRVHSISHAKLAPGWALIQVNFDPTLEMDMYWINTLACSDGKDFQGRATGFQRREGVGEMPPPPN